MKVPFHNFLPNESWNVRVAAHVVVEFAGTYDAEDAVLVAAGKCIAGLWEDMEELGKTIDDLRQQLRELKGDRDA